MVKDGHTPEVRKELRELRARSVKVGHLLGDELDLQPGDTLRGIPAGFTHPALCGAKSKAGHPCRAMAATGLTPSQAKARLNSLPRIDATPAP